MSKQGQNASVEARQMAFEKQLGEKLKQLQSPKSTPEQREAAAYWLGEAGDPTAIPALRNAYSVDNSKEVRAAAGYALGMFRALGDALEGSEQERERAMQLVERIVLEGKFGKRRSSKIWVRLAILLSVTLLLLAALNVVLPALRGGGASGTITLPQTSDTPDAVVRSLSILSEQLEADAAVVRDAYFAAIGQQPVNCDVRLINPPAYMLPAAASAQPQLISLSTEVNSAREILQTAQTPYVENCAALNPEALSEPLTAITQLLNVTLPDLRTRLAAAAESFAPPPTEFTPPPAVTEPPTPTPTLSASETPTELPATATERPNLRIHIGAMMQIIDTVTRRDGNGAFTQLALYWNDVAATGGTGGCQARRPTIPEEYALPVEASSASAELRAANESLRLGLQLLRDGWAVFDRACADGSLLTQQPAAAEAVRLAGEQFEAARTLLQGLIDQGF